MFSETMPSFPPPTGPPLTVLLEATLRKGWAREAPAEVIDPNRDIDVVVGNMDVVVVGGE